MTEQWFVAEAEHDGLPLMIRAMANMPAAKVRSQYPVQVRVFWTYPHDGSGMPDEDTAGQMDELLDSVDASLEQDAWAMEVAAITGAGAKEWRFYAREGQEFAELFSASLAGKPRYPLELQAYDDPDWDGLGELQC